MIRGLIIALNFFAAWFIAMLAGVPSATVKAPDKVTKGETFTVNVKINPNGVEDFLRFSMVIPDGWTAEKVEEDGSSFMFEKQTVKFLWSRVGKRDNLNISFKITPAADAEGTYEFPCKLSHSVDNLPSHVVLDPMKVIVGNSGTPAVGNYVPDKGDSTANPSANVSITRVVPTEPVNGEFLVDVTINKGELGSFIKLQDSLPAGFIAKPVTKDGGDWSFENGIVRVQWYAPNKAVSVLHVQYKVIVSPDVTGRYTINGHVSYVENMENKLISIAPSEITLKENPALVNTGNTGDNGKTGNTGNTGDNSGNTGKSQDPVANNNDGSKTNDGNLNGQKDINPLQDPQVNQTPGVSFHIQVAAMARRVSTKYYESTFGLGTVNAEQIDGLNKYTTGSFATYQDARNNRETVRGKGVEAPFVVAYNNGKRISVQEALMITSQKWIR
jgi:hypothetical protein